MNKRVLLTVLHQLHKLLREWFYAKMTMDGKEGKITQEELSKTKKNLSVILIFWSEWRMSRTQVASITTGLTFTVQFPPIVNW